MAQMEAPHVRRRRTVLRAGTRHRDSVEQLAQSVQRRWHRYLLEEVRVRIVFDLGQSPYHVAVGPATGVQLTQCGLPAAPFDAYIAVDHVEDAELADAALRHDWLQELQACPTCWELEQEA